MRFSTLHDWLSWQETLHPTEIELGLERVNQVWMSLSVHQLDLPVITVAGTNGKGSSIAFLQAIYLAAGYRVGSYTSPHLFHYNERICIDGEAVNEADIIQAFEHIDQARAGISLTYFEFGTLAALYLFARQMQSERPLDVVLLEVGLGGRLDAVNIIDADLAIITSIDLDHQSWLGESKEQIGKEKAGILKENKICVISDPNTPSVVEDRAKQLQCQTYVCHREYEYAQDDRLDEGNITIAASNTGSASWHWMRAMGTPKAGLPMPALNGQHQLQNAAGVLMAVDALAMRLPVSQQDIRQGLLNAHLSGRFDIRHNNATTTILDVAHNPAAARQLAKSLSQYSSGRVKCLFSILADKDITNVITPLLEQCDHWSIAPLEHPRSASRTSIKDQLHRLKPELVVAEFESVALAYRSMLNQAEPGDTLLVFGSFYTVAEVGEMTV